MSNYNTNLKIGFPSIWAPTDQKAPLCIGNKLIYTTKNFFWFFLANQLFLLSVSGMCTSTTVILRNTGKIGITKPHGCPLGASLADSKFLVKFHRGWVLGEVLPFPEEGECPRGVWCAHLGVENFTYVICPWAIREIKRKHSLHMT